MDTSKRNVLFLVEQACGPIDEALALYRDDMDPAHRQLLTQCRDLLEQILLDYDNDPSNPPRYSA